MHSVFDCQVFTVFPLRPFVMHCHSSVMATTEKLMMEMSLSYVRSCAKGKTAAVTDVGQEKASKKVSK